MKNPWKKLSSKVVHKNSFYYVRKDQIIRPDGTPGTYHAIVSPDSVFTVALDSKMRVCLVGQVRYLTGLYSLELPGGGSERQNPLAAAKRELWEETGLKAKKWAKLGTFWPCNGMLAEKSHIFLATGLEQTKQNKQLEDGIDRNIWIPMRKIMQMIKTGKITDGEAIAGLTLAALKLKIKF